MFSTSPLAVDAVTQLKMCYIFRQIFPFHSELWKGSFLPRMKDPGNEVAKHERLRSLDHNGKLIDSYSEYSFKTDEVMTICVVGDQL